jgi:hypothetical protein
MSIQSDFQMRVLKEKLNFGSELINGLDKMIRDIDLSKQENIQRVRDVCSEIEMFLKES